MTEYYALDKQMIYHCFNSENHFDLQTMKQIIHFKLVTLSFFKFWICFIQTWGWLLFVDYFREQRVKKNQFNVACKIQAHLHPVNNAKYKNKVDKINHKNVHNLTDNLLYKIYFLIDINVLHKIMLK